MIESLLSKLGISSIKELINKFKNKDIKFIGDNETQEKVLKIDKSTEAKFYKNYIQDKELRNLLRMGLVLRNLENNENKKLQNLRSKLSKNKDRLWFCQLVQNGLLKLYLDYLLENSFEINEIEEKINLIYINMEKFCYFINSQENKNDIKKEIIRLLTNKPEILLISSKNEATKNIKELKEKIIIQWETYYDYKINEDNKKLLIMFLQKI